MEKTVKSSQVVENAIMTIAIIALEASKHNKAVWADILMSFHQSMKKVNE